MTRPTKSDVAGARYLALRRLGQQTGRTTAELLQLYALEGFLARLATSGLRDRFVLKGGMLLAAFDARRPTRDVDLLALRVSADAEAVRVLIHDVARVALDDGLVFDLEETRVEAIRDDDVYPGVRVTLHAMLATARLVFHVDINVGDPVWPPPEDVRVPRLLSSEPLVVRGYPIAMVLAEKLVTVLQRGTANTRWRDFADLYLLAHGHVVEGAVLGRAAAEVATYRAVVGRDFGSAVSGFDVLGQAGWHAWRRRQRLEDRLPEAFSDALAVVVRLGSGAVSEEAAGLRWNPEHLEWRVARQSEDALDAASDNLQG